MALLPMTDEERQDIELAGAKRAVVDEERRRLRQFASWCDFEKQLYGVKRKVVPLATALRLVEMHCIDVEIRIADRDMRLMLELAERGEFGPLFAGQKFSVPLDMASQIADEPCVINNDRTDLY